MPDRPDHDGRADDPLPTLHDLDAMEVPSPSFAPDSEIGNFRIMRMIGKGGMGEVYLARDTRLGRKVALKVINPRYFQDKKAIVRFLFEARTTARFNHPNIVTVYSVDEHDGTPYLALEYLAGQSLRDRLKEPTGVREAIRIGLAIARALQEAHRHQILHGDLKPDNVLIPRDGQLRVLDFGLAAVIQQRLLDQESDEPGDEAAPPMTAMLRSIRTAARTIMDSAADTQNLCTAETALPLEAPPGAAAALNPGGGTPLYMAPEQWRNEARTGATDIWAMGMILYELATGHRPYDHEQITALASAVVSPDPVPRSGDLEKVPASLSRLILGCLQKSPERRPSADDVVQQLDRLLRPGQAAAGAEHRPFRGLMPFTERHADFFFGREAEVAAFLERIREAPVLPVVGPTGAGKSSFVQAGVIPRLREQGPWVLLRVRPGSRPFHALASRLLACAHTVQDGLDTLQTGDDVPITPAALAALARDEEVLAGELRAAPQLLNLKLQEIAAQERSRVLLFVDQLEELYTLVQDQEARSRYMQAICSAADDSQDPARVIFTLREDFIGRLGGGAVVREALSQVNVIWSPDSRALVEVLTLPLQAVGYGYDDPELVPEMVASVQGEPSCLSLLQFASRMLWDRRDTEARLLRRADYEAMGGVAGALARHADGVLKGLSPTELEQARALMLRLVTAEGTRRLVSLPRLLEGLGAGAGEVTSRLVEGRLLTIRRARGGTESGSELELVHESLIRTWGRLARWIDESREELVFLDEITQAAELWDRRGCRREEVWRGQALEETRRSIRRFSSPVPDVVTRFIDAGVRKHRQRTRRLRFLIATLIIIPTFTAVMFIAKHREAVTQKMQAEAQRKQARSRWAEAQREGGRAALGHGSLLEARAKVRGSLEREDSVQGRVLWWQLSRQGILWSKTLGDSIYGVAISPDGKTIAAASQNRSIYLIDVQTQQVKVLRGHDDQLFTVAFSPDGKRLASAGWGKNVRVWDLIRGGSTTLVGHDHSIRDVEFSHDGRWLGTASADHTVRIWDLARSRVRWTLRGHTNVAYDLDFSRDDQRLATGSRDETVRIWDLTSGAQLRVLRGHRGSVEAVAFSPDGESLASGSWDQSIRLWSVSSGRPLRVLEGHTANVSEVTFSRDGKTLISGSWDRTLRFWDPATGARKRTLRGHTGGVYDVALSRGGEHLVSGGWDRSIRVWNTASTRGEQVDQGHTGAVYGVAFSPDSKVLASASLDKSVRIWDVASGRQLRTLRGHTNSAEGVAFSPDGKRLVTSGSDKTIRIWDPAVGAQLAVLVGHGAEVNNVAVSPDGKLLASASHDRTIRLWSFPAGNLIRVLKGHGAGIRGLDFSARGELASAGHDGTARIWDVRTGAMKKVLAASRGTRFGVSFNATGDLLAIGGEDRTVRLWDAARGKDRLLARLESRVYIVDFHPGGEWIGAPCSDGVARLIRVKDGSSRSLVGHRSEVNFFRFDRGGKLAATSSDDGTVRVWEIPGGRPRWRGPLLLSRPPRLLSHQGWTTLDGSRATTTRTRWRRAAEIAAREADMSADGSYLCMATFDDHIERWDAGQDRRSFRRREPGIRQVLASNRGCLALTPKGVVLHAARGSGKVLLPRAAAIAPDRDGVLVALEKKITLLSHDGIVVRRLPGAPGISTMLRTPGWLVAGFKDGTIELFPLAGQSKPSYLFDKTPSSPVTRLLTGPKDTLIAGFASGFWGLWDMHNGELLHRARLHGSVRHLLIEGKKLYVATDLGQHQSMDLSIFQIPYCDLMRTIWTQVPVIWNDGLPRLHPPSKTHTCFE